MHSTDKIKFSDLINLIKNGDLEKLELKKCFEIDLKKKKL